LHEINEKEKRKKEKNVKNDKYLNTIKLLVSHSVKYKMTSIIYEKSLINLENDIKFVKNLYNLCSSNLN